MNMITLFADMIREYAYKASFVAVAGAAIIDATYLGYIATGWVGFAYLNYYLFPIHQLLLWVAVITVATYGLLKLAGFITNLFSKG
jgi:TM2 domain-containing membrane protein YozV